MRGLKAFVIACIAGASLYAQTASRSAEWTTYSGGAEGQRYSPLSQINTKNVSGLKLAWQYGAREDAARAFAALGDTIDADIWNGRANYDLAQSFAKGGPPAN